MNNIISTNLRKLRLEKNLTQEQVAEVLGVSTQTISRWECNTTCPDIMMLPEIARLYCVTVDDLFREDSSAYENYAQRLASVYEATHNPEDFLKADIEFKKLKRSRNYSPEDCRIHGNLYFMMMDYCKEFAIKNYKKVITEFEKERNILPENITYWKTRYQIIKYYINIGAGEAICQHQEEKVKNSINNYMEWTVLIYAYHYYGEQEKAYKIFTESKEKFPDKWVIYEIGSNVCRALRKFDEAIECCNKAVELNSDFLDAMYSKAFCYEELGDFKNAYETWVYIVDFLKKDGYDIEAQEEEKRAQACLEKMKQ